MKVREPGSWFSWDAGSVMIEAGQIVQTPEDRPERWCRGTEPTNRMIY